MQVADKVHFVQKALREKNEYDTISHKSKIVLLLIKEVRFEYNRGKKFK